MEIPKLFAKMKRVLFRVIARTAIATYSRVPIFGYLRASIAVLRKDDLILVIDRNDARGFSFPGGLAHLGETAEQAMLREVEEETGLKVEKSSFLFDYRSTADIPCVVSVFEIEASGNLAESWEGLPRWLSRAEIKPRLLPSQTEVLTRLFGVS
jgi:8-oxo-dGTP pyrophosphatase MutT (NUDIX family)